jgi:DNA-directed RNA polymerase subunit L
MKNIKIELNENELHTIMNILTVKSLSGNLDEEDKTLGRKINKAIDEIEGGK